MAAQHFHRHRNPSPPIPARRSPRTSTADHTRRSAVVYFSSFVVCLSFTSSLMSRQPRNLNLELSTFRADSEIMYINALPIIPEYIILLPCLAPVPPLNPRLVHCLLPRRVL